jgi:hypothetical protein
MLDSGAATTKPGPAYMARGFHSISSSVSMSLLPVLLLSPSSSSSACGRQRFLCTSRRSLDDARLIVHVLLTREDVPDDDEDEAAITAFLCASHRSAESARPGLGSGVVAFLMLLLTTLWAEGGRDDDEAEDAGQAGFVLCASC